MIFQWPLWIYKRIERHPLYWRLIFLLVIILPLFFLPFMHFEADIFSLFPTRDRAIRAWIDLVKTPEGYGTVYILISRSDGKIDNKYLIEKARLLKTRLLQIKSPFTEKRLFKKITFTKETFLSSKDIEIFLRSYLSYPHLFLTKNDVERLKEILSPENIQKSLRKTFLILQAPVGTGYEKIFLIDPLGLRNIFLERLRLHSMNILSDINDIMLSPDKRYLLIKAISCVDAGKRDQARNLLKRLKELFKDYPSLHIEMAGGVVLAAQQEIQMKKELFISLIMSFFGVIGILLFSFHSPRIVLFMPVPLVASALWAILATGFIMGNINLITASFSVLILALGIDYSIHIVQQFKYRLSLHSRADTALDKAIRTISRPIIMGGLTTIAAFLSFIFSNTPGLKSISLFVSLGLLASLPLTIIGWSIYLPWLSRGNVLHGPLRGNHILDALYKWVQHRKFIILSIAILSFVIASLFFESDGLIEVNPQNMLPRELPAIETSNKIRKIFSLSENNSFIAVYGNSIRELIVKEEEVIDKISHIKRKPFKYIAISDFIPGISSKISPPIYRPDIPIIKKMFEKFGLKLSDFPYTYNFLTSLSNSIKIKEEELWNDPFIGRMLNRFVYKEKRGYMSLISLDIKDMAKIQAKIEGIRGIDILSKEIFGNRIMKLIKKDFFKSISIAIVIIIILLACYYKKFKYVLLTLIPLSWSIVLFLFFIQRLNIHVNFVNFIVFPLIIGLGIDDGIHIVDRYIEEGSIRHLFHSVGMAIFTTSITTIIGFASLSLSSYPPIRDLGILTVIGMGLTLISSLLLLPAILSCLKGR